MDLKKGLFKKRKRGEQEEVSPTKRVKRSLPRKLVGKLIKRKKDPQEEDINDQEHNSDSEYMAQIKRVQIKELPSISCSSAELSFSFSEARDTPLKDQSRVKSLKETFEPYAERSEVFVLEDNSKVELSVEEIKGTIKTPRKTERKFPIFKGDGSVRVNPHSHQRANFVKSVIEQKYLPPDKRKTLITKDTQKRIDVTNLLFPLADWDIEEPIHKSKEEEKKEEEKPKEEEEEKKVDDAEEELQEEDDSSLDVKDEEEAEEQKDGANEGDDDSLMWEVASPVSKFASPSRRSIFGSPVPQCKRKQRKKKNKKKRKWAAAREEMESKKKKQAKDIANQASKKRRESLRQNGVELATLGLSDSEPVEPGAGNPTVDTENAGNVTSPGKVRFDRQVLDKENTGNFAMGKKKGKKRRKKRNSRTRSIRRKGSVKKGLARSVLSERNIRV